MLTVDGLTVTYGAFTAVRDAHLRIADGEVLALLGPSGSGKSTLLRAITGLESVADGSVRWNGTDLAPVPVHKRGFGLVFQDGQLFPHRDVAGNIAFGLRMHDVDRRERDRRIGDLLELVGLSGYERRRVTELSGGEAQRVALARALAPQPRLLLLDEPLSGLDAGLREQLAVDLAGLLRQARITTLLVTHDQDEAFTLADEVAVLTAGRIRQSGPVQQVWRHPADDEVATFLGVTTVVEAHARDGVATTPFGEVTLAELPDGPVRLGLRPSALRVSAGSGVRGEVLSRVHRRDHVRLRVRLGTAPDGGHPVDAGDAVDTVDAVAPVTAELKPGDEVTVALDAEGVATIG